MKVCGSCKSPKPLTEYNEHKSRSGHQNYCRECQKIDKRFRRYGVTKHWYEEKLKEQDGRCMGCKIHVDDYRKEHKVHTHLVVDHCHETGKPRGLLCNNCNVALGCARDDPQTLSRLAKYIRKFKI